MRINSLCWEGSGSRVGVLVRERRFAVLVAIAVAVTIGPLSAKAQASSTPTTYYVDNSKLSVCSDGGSGTQAQPFCTVQAAADAAAVPGDTVIVTPGSYPEQVDITASGTAAAPITFKSGGSAGRPRAVITSLGADDHYGFVLTGASNIVIDDFSIAEAKSAIVIDDSSAVTVNGTIAGSDTSGYAPIQVNGSSSHITLSRDEASGGWRAPGIAIDASGSGNVVTTDLVLSETGDGGGISVKGSSGAVITSNSVIQQCGPGIYLGDDANGTASGATIENNVVGPDTTACPSAGAGIVLASTADTVGALLNYNDVYPGSGVDAYAWAGANYADAAALHAATGQAAADSNADPGVDMGTGRITSPTSPLISSANSDAPGELATDSINSSRTCDPLVAATGTGHSACYDRGAFQYEETITLSGSSYPPTTVPVGAVLTANAGAASSNWGQAAFDYSFDFGDGTKTDGSRPTATHAYATPGSYWFSETVTSSFGGRTGTSFWINVVPPVAFSYRLSTSVSGALGIEATVSITSAWELTNATISFGDGSSAGAYPWNGPIFHTYAKPGIYPVTLTVSDTAGDKGSVTNQFSTQGNDFVPYGPKRLLDTRSGLGGTAGQLAGDGSITLKIAGNGAIPAGVKAVALNLTGLDATGGGYIQVDEGAGDSGTSNLNYSAGSIFNNSVVAPVAPGGTVTLRNFAPSGVKLDLVADVSGYYAPTAGDGYTALAQARRILDTRLGPGGNSDKLNSGGTVIVTVAGAGDVVPPTGVTAVAVNVTETGTTQSGYLTLYPDGSGARPVASNLNWQGPMTRAVAAVVPVGADGKIDIYNGSGNGGGTNVILDVTGYFTASSGGALYVPVAPARVLDTRTSGKPVGANSSYTLKMSGLGGTPASGSTVTGYVINATVTQTHGGGWLAVGAVGTSAPQTSTLNWTGANQTVANLAYAGDMPGQPSDPVSFYNGGGNGSIQLVIDVMGYFVES